VAVDWRVSAFSLAPLEWNQKNTTWTIEIDYQGCLYTLFGALAYRIFLMIAGEPKLYLRRVP